jgi:hypothetical protein
MSAGGLEGEEDKADPNRISLTGLAGYLVPALAAWLLIPFFARTQNDGVSLWFGTVLALIFAIGLQTAFYEMLPIRGLYGWAIFRGNRYVWFGLLAFIGFLFMQTQLNPDGSLVSAFNKPNMVALGLFVAGFCILSALTWFYFNRVDRLSAPPADSIGE